MTPTNPAISAWAQELLERPVIKQHPLAVMGRYIQTNDVREWTLPEALAWIRTRDLGLVAGISACLAATSLPFHRRAAAALELLDRAPHWKPEDDSQITESNSKPLPAEEVLRHLLHIKKLTARGRRAANRDGPLHPIPTKDWEEGAFTLEAGGSWEGVDPLLQVHWQDLRFERGLLEGNAPRPELTQELPGQEAWVPLVNGLMWIAYRHAVPLLRLRTMAANQDGPSLEHYRKALQIALQSELSVLRKENAEEKHQSSLRIKGSPIDGETVGCEQLLTPDQLAKATCLEWIKLPASGDITAALLEAHGSDSYSLIPARLRGYVDVHLHRGDLIARYGPRDVAALSGKRSGSLRADPRGETLEAWLQRMFVKFQHEPVPKSILMKQAKRLFECSKIAFKRAWQPPEHLRAVWSRTGPRKRRSYHNSEFD